MSIFCFLSWALIRKPLSKYFTSKCLYYLCFLICMNMFPNSLYMSKSKKVKPMRVLLCFSSSVLNGNQGKTYICFFPIAGQIVFSVRLLNLLPRCTFSPNYQVTFQTWHTYLYLEWRNQWEKKPDTQIQVKCF